MKYNHYQEFNPSMWVAVEAVKDILKLVADLHKESKVSEIHLSKDHKEISIKFTTHTEVVDIPEVQGDG